MNGITKCPGLEINKEGITFKSVTGRVYDLATEPLLRTGEVGMLMGRSRWWVRRQFVLGRLYPGVKASSRDIEIYKCAIADFRARQHLAAEVSHA